MARVTVEDCEKIIPNRFDLVVCATQRARQIISGDAVTLDKTDNKVPVLSLREIASQSVSAFDLMESAINSFRSVAPKDDMDEEAFLEDDLYNPYEGDSLALLEADGFSETDLEDTADDLDESELIDESEEPLEPEENL